MSVLKRKRSDSEISTTSSILSSPLSSNIMNFDSFNTSQIQPPSLFSSRTRKRHRDNRPNENAVHRTRLLPPTCHAAQRPSIQPPLLLGSTQRALIFALLHQLIILGQYPDCYATKLIFSAHEL
ncbi:hypothetical protein D0Z07_8745 [Hyphodiscus hymeniophilus]|uniref:Uncharacterized protein n=1 Tax=Hyphodiscus hymeniophilus TaxID=353542 RepID=A0A9P6SKV4_9HELO|nr:hypothetical protein D0Z07_8745 [Hyphodiscus hymeniophilus]